MATSNLNIDGLAIADAPVYKTFEELQGAYIRVCRSDAAERILWTFDKPFLNAISVMEAANKSDFL